MLEKDLKKAGLSENEAQVYLTLLKTGPSSSYSLSQQINLNRGYIYELLKKLHERGIVSEILKGDKKYYCAADPEQLATFLEFKLRKMEEKVNRFKILVPQLKEIINTWKEDTKIKAYKGKFCLKIILNDVIATLEENSEVLMLGGNEKSTSLELEPDYSKRYLNIIKRKNIKERFIVKKGTIKLQEAETTEYRFLSEDYIGNMTQFIYGEKVALLTLSEPLSLIIIEDKDVAGTYRKQFEIFWSVAEE